MSCLTYEYLDKFKKSILHPGEQSQNFFFMLDKHSDTELHPKLLKV